jgi:hypothetical protein
MRRLLLLPTLAWLVACNGSGLEADGPAGTLAGTISVGPFCPVEVEGEECPAPPGTYESIRVLVYVGPSALGRLVADARPDAEGRFALALPAGTYRVTLEHSIGIPSGASPPFQDARVDAGATTSLSFEIDTGIR